MIHDNACYHKDGEGWAWFRANRTWLEVHPLPPYAPELNPAERLWQHAPKNRTHNRYFARPMELPSTLSRVFAEMQDYADLVRSYWLPFC